MLASCTRVNGAYEDDGTPSTSADDGLESSATTNSGTSPSSSSASGGAEGTSTADSTSGGAPDPTTGAEGTTTNGDGQENTSNPAEGSTTGEVPPEACCSPDGACENQEVSECACAADMDRCCDQAWDIYCVVLAVSQGCVECGAAPPHDCCMGSLSPGCNDYDLMACVCAENVSCCDQAWEPSCATAAADCPESPCL